MKGIVNIGNSCYLNSALQLIFNSKICNNIVNISADKNISDDKNIISHNIKYYYSNNLQPFNPHEIKNLIDTKTRIFHGMGQQDSSEFLIYLLDIIDTFSHEKLYSIFGLHSNINIKCKLIKCLHESSHNEIELVLFLPLTNETHDLNDSYRLYKSTVILEKESAFKCEKCNNFLISRKRTIVTKWPDELIIVLKRFDNMMIKNNKKMLIPLIWRHGYKLQGGIIHMGNLHGGHYIYFGYNNNTNQWYIANDATISIITNIDEFMVHAGSDSYILHYIKNTI